MSLCSGLSVRHQLARPPTFGPIAAEMLEQRVLLTSVVVNTTADLIHAPGSTIISLRDAISTANKSTSPTTISFSPSVFGTHQAITLGGSALEFSGKQPLVISGPTSGVTIDGNAKSADFVIDKGAKASIYRVTFTGGNNTSGRGGAIANNGTLTLNAVAVTANADNSADNSMTPVDGSGGGIYNGGAHLKLISVLISDNTSDGAGAGIYNAGSLTTSSVTISGNRGNGHDADEPTSQGGGIDNTGSMTLSFTYITGNNGGGTAGGIENESGAKMTLANTAISGNSAVASGGIDNLGSATITHATVSGNSSGFFVDPGGSIAGSTGGISNEGAMTLVDCTIAANSSSNEAGGIFNSAKLTLADSTVSGNIAMSVENGAAFQPTLTPGDGGGLFATASSSTLIENTIIAGNEAIGGKGADVYGAVQSKGFNLIGQTDGSSGWRSTDRTGSAAHPLNALLSRLGYFGGATQTMVPASQSPAVNHGSNALIPSGLTTDQRGLRRIAGGTVDIGAVELQPM